MHFALDVSFQKISLTLGSTISFESQKSLLLKNTKTSSIFKVINQEKFAFKKFELTLVRSVGVHM